MSEIFSVGMVVKNYKTMCELTGECYQKNGTPKREQQENWKRFIDWEKDGNKYIITEVKDNPEPEIIKKGKSKQLNYFGFILLRLLKQNDDELYLFKGQLFEEMYIQSIAYRSYCKSKSYKLPEIQKINREIGQMFKRWIDSMTKKGLITYQEIPVKIYYDMFDRLKIEELDEDELKDYEKLKVQAIDEYDLEYNPYCELRSKMNKIYAKGHGQIYYNILEKLVLKRFSDCENVCNRIKITRLADAVYPVDEKTVYKDLSVAVNTRLRAVAEKYFERELDDESYTRMLELIDLNSSIDYISYDFDHPYMLGVDDNGFEHVIATHEELENGLDIDYYFDDDSEEPSPMSEYEHERELERTIITDENTIRELNIMYEKYGNNMWDDSDEEYIPDGTTPF